MNNSSLVRIQEKIRALSRSSKNFLRKKGCSLLECQTILPDEVSPYEVVARVISGGTSPRSIKKLFNPDTEEVNPSQFLDSRDPMCISVNRVSTLSTQKAHQLGIEHTNQNNAKNPDSPKTYYGFAKIESSISFEQGCKIVKEDYEGEKPHHANLIYPIPQSQKSNDMSIATHLALRSKLIKN